MKLLHDNVLIVCICGMSGSGKDTFARMLVDAEKEMMKEKADLRLVCSYTTRQIREGETQGREHIFLDEMPRYDEGELFAHVVYGGKDYWTTETQIRQCAHNLYIIDEDSLLKLMAKSARYKERKLHHPTPAQGEHQWPWTFTVVPVLVQSNAVPPMVSEERTKRDIGRDFNKIQWAYTVKNFGGLDFLYEQAQKMIRSLHRLNVWKEVEEW